MVVLMFTGNENDTTVIGNRTSDVFKLNGGVMYMKSVRQQMVDAMQNLTAARRRHVLNHHMAAQRVRVGTQTPDMQIVNIQHAADSPDRRRDCTNLHASRLTFQQNVERLADNIPGSPDDQDRDNGR